jgi:uncharacterized membrane protein YhhN
MLYGKPVLFIRVKLATAKAAAPHGLTPNASLLLLGAILVFFAQVLNVALACSALGLMMLPIFCYLVISAVMAAMGASERWEKRSMDKHRTRFKKKWPLGGELAARGMR